jgi:hypothetical protein
MIDVPAGVPFRAEGFRGMSVSGRKAPAQATEGISPELEAEAKQIAAWVLQFARTLKNCRLYDASNPAVAKLKQDLLIALQRLLDEQGPIMLRFSADDVLYENVSVYPARSREDNLALPFYRDGIRGLAFLPGIQPHELAAVLDGVLHVTGQTPTEDDLVTLLWQAHLEHIDVDYVPASAEVGSGTTDGNDPNAVPWPTAAAEAEPEAEAESEIASEEEASADTPAEAESGRSDDWEVGEKTAEIEASFAELEAISAAEVERFRSEFEEEHRTSAVTTALAVSRAYLGAGVLPDDSVELARFLPRVLRQAFVMGSWRESSEALALLRRCESQEWVPETFAQELLQPISVSSIKDRLEQQDGEAAADFVGFARQLGDPAVDLFSVLVCEVEKPNLQKALTDALVDLCREQPERLAPLLDDKRWFVVRNAVQILGAIGGRPIVGLLQAVVQHPEPRVRLEVAAALRHVDPKAAQPLLVRMLDGADTRMFCSILHQLSQARDPGISRMLLTRLVHPDFEKRPAEEKRSIYSAIASAGGDEVVPELEAELHKGSWFSRAHDAHRQAVARCIGRIGTPLARTALERGAQSKRPVVRKACEDVLARFGSHE